MYRFERHAPLDTTPYPDPADDDRKGPPLSQGFLLTMIGTLAAEHCSPETLEAFSDIEPNTWYHGQLLESVLNDFEDQDAELPVDIGKNIYYTLRSQFRSMGLSEPKDVIATMPSLWQHVTRGDSGEWRSSFHSPQHATVELEQPYNCHFEAGALHGALEAFDATDVIVKHVQCMRDGAPCCILDVSWQK